jgi:hypothetical protein
VQPSHKSREDDAYILKGSKEEQVSRRGGGAKHKRASFSQEGIASTESLVHALEYILKRVPAHALHQQAMSLHTHGAWAVVLTIAASAVKPSGQILG